MFCVGAPVVLAAPDTQALKAKADQINLHDHPQWRAQLFYVNRVFRRDTGIVDSPNFYLSPTGKDDLRSELHALIDALVVPGGAGKQDDHPRCRFPRRFGWVVEQLGVDPAELPSLQCSDYDEWRTRQGITGFSLVFASYFISNPASMFGHTFLRLHRSKGPAGSEPNALLDSAVNFAANPTTENALLYPLLGMTGGFPGTFSLMPYYLKVQEYNNAESRDLWEYPMNLSASQVDHLMQTLWEVGPVHINYWYIDENCSYVLLLLLDTVDPTWRLADYFNVMATPADTLRIAVRAQGLLGPPKYRPSALSKYLQRESQLERSEIPLMKSLLVSSQVDIDPIIAAATDDSARARIIDAALDYIDFDEEVAGSRLPEKMLERRQALLKARAKIRVIPIATKEVPFRSQPDLGHLSMRVGLGVGHIQVSGADPSTYYDFDWRPTLHDIAVPSEGYSTDLQIKMLEFKFRKVDKQEQRAELWRRARWFEVLSIPPLGTMKKPIAWALSIRSERTDSELSQCLVHDIEGGAGIALGSPKVRFFSLGMLHLTGRCQKNIFNGAGAAGPLLALGAIYEWTAPFKLFLTWHRERLWGAPLAFGVPDARMRDTSRYRLQFTSLFSAKYELALRIDRTENTYSIANSNLRQNAVESALTYGYYF